MKTQFGGIHFFLIYPKTPIFCRVTKIELESSKSKPYYPLINVVKFIYSEKATKFVKSPPFFWLVIHRTKVRWRFRKILWPSENIWTLMFSLLLTFNNRTNCLKALAGVWKFTMKNEITQFLQKSVRLKGLHFRSTTYWVQYSFWSSISGT